MGGSSSSNAPGSVIVQAQIGRPPASATNVRATPTILVNLSRFALHVRHATPYGYSASVTVFGYTRQA